MLSFLPCSVKALETVIFYESIYTMSRDTRGMWIGGLTAVVLGLASSCFLPLHSVKIPIGPFFRHF